MIRTAMVLAAGEGRRMRPLSLTRPKPLIELAGRTLLDHALDRLVAAGVERAVVNHRWLGEQVAAHVKPRRDIEIILSPETTNLENGGGIVHALPFLGSEPFLVLNADIYWLNGPTPAIDRLIERWDPEAMDALLLVQRMVTGFGCEGAGDYFLDPAGRLAWRGEARVAPHIYAGVNIAHPRLFADPPPPPFSQKFLWDRVEAEGRLWGLLHDGLWFHLSTPADVDLARSYLAEERLV